MNMEQITEIKDEIQTKTFTQEEVNKIIEQRLARERAQNGGLSALRAKLREMYADGWFERYAGGAALSVPEMARIVAKFADYITSSVAPEDGSGRDSIDAAEGIGPPERDTRREDAEIADRGRDAAPGSKMNAEKEAGFTLPLEMAEEFMRYLAHRDGAQNHICTGETKDPEDGELHGRLRSTASAREHRADGAYGLTDRQRQLARAGGMSYREYYDLLTGIPQKNLTIK